MDSRRRAIPSRPVSSEEVECWTHASDSLRVLSAIYARQTTLETIGRVNRLISAWPTDDTLPTEGLGSLKTIQAKLASGLEDIKTHSEQDVKAIDDALERVSVLIALRKAPEALLSEKRNKRPRAPSPSGTPVPVQSALGNTRSVSITLPPRTNSVGPTSHLRDSRTKKDSFSRPQPLQPGRKVVFRPPKSADAEEGTWIVAIITRVINSSKEGGKYEVQDAEPQEDGQPGATYTASLKTIVPLPEPGVAIGSPAHLSLHPIFPVGSTVLALYPDTSCFYRAEVIAVPVGDKSSSSTKYTPTYQVKFEDDEDMIHNVSAYWVVQFPAHLLVAPKQGAPK
ncbi:SGF29 tudor-like domain-containing protein [Flammula alnicola]|nr:SGF29 tudor-like domain-containing protein [Flammula alnicola]